MPTGSIERKAFHSGDKVMIVGELPENTIGRDLKETQAVGVVVGEGYDPDYPTFSPGPYSDGNWSKVEFNDLELMVMNKDLQKVAHVHTGVMRDMTCAVCGGDAGRFEQYWNRDNGFGICRSCVDWLKSRGADDELKGYGVEGVNYAGPEQASEQPIAPTASMKVKADTDILDAVGEPLGLNDNVVDLNTNETGVVIDTNNEEAFVDWDNGRQEWVSPDMLLKAASLEVLKASEG